VAQRQQVLGERPAAVLVVRHDRVHPEGVPPDHRDPAAGALEAGELRLGLGLDPRVAVAGAGHDDDADPLRDEVPDLPQLVVRVAAGVADLHEQVLRVGEVDDAAGDLREVRVVDLVHDQADGGAGAAGQGAGERVRHVTQLLGHPADAAGHLLADAVAAGERAGGGRQGHAGALRDIGEPQPRAGFGHRFSPRNVTANLLQVAQRTA
jgi:hypothetical protein